MVLAAKGLVTCITGACQDQAKNHQAATLLASALSQQNMQRVINCTTAKEIWEALEANFENKSSTEKTMLLEEFTSFKIRSLSEVSAKIGEIQALAAKLKSFSVKIDDDLIISILLKALPESMKTWSSTWRQVNAEKPSLNGLITGIMAEIKTMKKPESSALVARTKSNWNNKTGGNSKIDSSTCHYCKKTGHWIRDCRKKKSDDARKSKDGMALKATSNDIESNLWLADSGSSYHMTPKLHWIHNYRPLENEQLVHLGDGHCLKAVGIGEVNTKVGTLKEVRYVPELKSNLFSISAVTKRGITVQYKREFIELSKNGKVIIKGSQKEGVYVLNLGFEPMKVRALLAKGTLVDWHRRFAHISTDTIKEMAMKELVNGLKIEQGEEIKCVECLLNKCKQSSHANKSSPKTKIPGACLHFDTAGPMKVESLGGARYMLLCKDEASSYKLVRFVESKADVSEQVKQVISQANLETGNNVSGIFTDNGSEYIKDDLKRFIADKGIIHKTSAPYTPQQNGLIEREIRTVVESARTMINQSGLGPELWAEASNTAVYTLNRCLTSRNQEKTPYEMWFGKKPDVRNLHYFGQRAVVMYRDYPRNKWNTKGTIHRFVGYTDVYNTFKFLDEKDFRIYVSCDVEFLDDETKDKIKNSGIDEELRIDENNQEMNDHEEIDQDQTRQAETTGYATRIDLSWDYENQDKEMLLEFDEESEINTTDSTLKDHSTIHEGTENSDTSLVTNIPTTSNVTKRTIEVSRNSLSDGDGEITGLISERRSSIPRIISANDIVKTSKGEELTSARTRPVNKSKVRLDRPKSSSDRCKPSDIHPKHIIESRTRSKGNKTADDTTPKYHAKLAIIEPELEPRTYKEAMTRSDKEKWKKAMLEELESLDKNEVYDIVDRPSCNVVTNKWVLKIKRKSNGEVERYKARLVARGFSQIYGIDYLETYAPVANMVSIRMLFAYAAMNNLAIAQFDVKTAFLYGDLEEPIYMEQPEGFDDNPNKVWKLKRSLYGLKQSPRQWNKKFRSFLEERKLSVSDQDNCVFYRKEPLLIIAIYVDDGLVFAKNYSEIEEIINQLNDRFDIHRMELSTFLGFQIHKDQHKIKLSQSNYIKNILKRFNMEDCKSVENPLTIDKTIRSEKPLDENVPFREAIGCLMYAAVISRLDIAYAVSKASRKVENPTEKDWMDVKRIFRYLKGKEHYGIEYHKCSNSQMMAYCDADFAGDEKTSRSTTGALFLLGGAPIQWRSQRQALVTLSSTEAEFVSLCSAVKETMWLRKLGTELGILKKFPTDIFCDNQSAIRIASNEKTMQRTRHMSVQTAYPREQIEAGNINVKHISSQNQLADILTKPTTTGKFKLNLLKLMTISLLLLCLVEYRGITQGYIFDRVNPLVWRPIENHVEINTTVYDLELTYTSPCKIIDDQAPKTGIEFLTKPDISMYQDIKRKCEESFDIMFVNKMNAFIKVKPNSPIVGLTRVKRIPPFVLLFVLTPFVISGVTNLVTALMSEFIPGGDGYRIRELQHQQAIDKEKILELEKKVNLQSAVDLGIQERLNELSVKVMENKNILNHMEDTIPAISWTAAYLQVRIAEASNYLDHMIMARLLGQAHPYYIGKLWNFTRLEGIRNEDTILEEVTRVSESTIFMKISVRNRSPDTHVYEVFTFDYLDDLATEPKLMKYDGPKHLIYNSTSQCVKAIDEPKFLGVQEECTVNGFKDPRLSRWVKSAVTKDFIPRPSFKRILTHNYIYCYGHNITFNDETHICPTYPFKLPLEIAFKAGDLDHHSKVVKIAVDGPKWKTIDTQLPSLMMPKQSLSEVHMLKSLKEREIESTNYTTMSLLLISLIIICTLLIYIIVDKIRTRKHETDIKFHRVDNKEKTEPEEYFMQNTSGRNSDITDV